VKNVNVSTFSPISIPYTATRIRIGSSSTGTVASWSENTSLTARLLIGKESSNMDESEMFRTGENGFVPFMSAGKKRCGSLRIQSPCSNRKTLSCLASASSKSKVFAANYRKANH
jgi:hypothetical protein